MSKLLKCYVHTCLRAAYADSLYCIDHKNRPLWERVLDVVLNFLIGGRK